MAEKITQEMKEDYKTELQSGEFTEEDFQAWMLE